MNSPLTPPDAAEASLVLHAPEAPAIVQPEEAPGMVPVPDERRAEIDRQAREFVAGLAKLDARSPEFSSQVDGINKIGSAEITASSNSSSRLLERSSTSIAGAKKSGNSAQVAVANTLGELRSTVEDLTPTRPT